MDGILTAINDFFRGIIWAIVDVFLFILDCVWEIVLRIAMLDISTNSDFQSFFWLIVTFIVLFLIFRICKITIKIFFDSEYREKFSISQMLIKLILCSMLVGFAPFVYQGVCYISTDAIKHVETFIPLETEELSMSSILLQAGRVNISSPGGDLGPEITKENFDINKKDTNDNYMYFPSYSNIFMMIIVSIVAVFIFVMTALQIAQRVYMIMFKYLMAPYTLASIVDPEDNTFGTWVKMIGGDLIMNFAQIYGTYFLMFMCNNTAVQNMLGDDWIALFARIVLFIGGLLALQELPSVIAGLTGGSGRGIMQSLQDLKSMKAASVGMVGGAAAIGGSVAGGTISGVGSAVRGGQAGVAAAKAGYAKGSNPVSGVFRGAGAVAMAGLGAAATPVKKKASDLYHGGFGSYVQSARMKAQSSGSGGSSQSINPSYDLEPTEKQKYAAQSLGIDNPGDYSRGELSMLMQEAGADESFWNDSSKGKGFINKVNSDSGLDSGKGLDLAAAKYYGIEGAEQMSENELSSSLMKKGHQATSVSSKKKEAVSIRANDMYQVNLNKTKRKK